MNHVSQSMQYQCSDAQFKDHAFPDLLHFQDEASVKALFRCRREGMNVLFLPGELQGLMYLAVFC